MHCRWRECHGRTSGTALHQLERLSLQIGVRAYYVSEQHLSWVLLFHFDYNQDMSAGFCG
jgi:hypothetical protein